MELLKNFAKNSLAVWRTARISDINCYCPQGIELHIEIQCSCLICCKILAFLHSAEQPSPDQERGREGVDIYQPLPWLGIAR